MKKIAIASVFALAAVSAQAQSVYADVAYQMIDTELNSDPAAIRGIVGYQYSPNLAAEAMLGLGIKDGTDSSFGIPAKAKLDRLVGIYAKPSYKINDAVELYGRVGIASYKISASASSGGFAASTSDSGSSFSFGAGASYKVSPAMSINLDYMDFGDLEGGVAVGVKFAF